MIDRYPDAERPVQCGLEQLMSYTMTTVYLFGGKDDDEFILSALPESSTTNYNIRTGFGDDTVRAGALDDEIRTSKGNDTVYAGAGNDKIWTGNQNDYVDAGYGDDYVSAGAGNDIVKGGKGNDTILGGSGNDTLYGVKGNNYLDGGTGNDVIHTGRQASTAIGGEGDDILKADLSKGADHTLTGGTGADTFEFVSQKSKRGADVTITDFELGVDEMIVQGMTTTEWAAAYASGAADITAYENTDGNMVIDLGFKDTVTLEGISLADLLDYFG